VLSLACARIQALDSFVCTPSDVNAFVDTLPTLSSIGYLRVNVQLMKGGEQPHFYESAVLGASRWNLLPGS
jgi:hypothetical protein